MTNKIISFVTSYRLYILIGVSLIFSLNTNAQSFSLGARGGISIPNLTASGNNQTPLSTGYSSRLGADAGIFAEYKFTKLFSLQLMLQYSEQGGKKNGLQAFTTPDALKAMYPEGQAPQYLYANYNSESKLNYLMVPLLAKCGWNIKNTAWRIYIDAGPFVAFLLSAHQVTSGSSQFYTDATGQNALPTGTQSFDNTSDIKDQLHTANFGIEGNLGISYHLGHGNIFIEGGGNYGFLNIQKNAADGKNNTGAGTVAIGYCYSFGK
jgi:hypothetical protein